MASSPTDYHNYPLHYLAYRGHNAKDFYYSIDMDLSNATCLIRPRLFMSALSSQVSQSLIRVLPLLKKPALDK